MLGQQKGKMIAYQWKNPPLFEMWQLKIVSFI